MQHSNSSTCLFGLLPIIFVVRRFEEQIGHEA
jgi:hypothetical protein